MSVATYPTAYPAATYPPGVLTGRPMEMFEAAPALDLYATPEQWAVGHGDVAILEELTDALRERDLERDGNMAEIQDLLVGLESIPDGEWIESRDRGNHSWSATLTIAATALDQFEEDFDYEEFLRMNNIVEVDMEMEEVLDDIDLERQEEMDWIEQQLQLLERFQDKTAYYMYPMVWDGGVIVLHDLFSSFGIKEALQQFEEDFDYEESLVQEKLKNTEVNFHRLLATPPEDRTGWCGESSYQEPHGSGSLIKERYRFEAKVVHDFPSSRQGYALAETVYGKIYIPEKFRGYVGPVGSTIDVTVALQDVSPKANGKTNSFRFSAIYLH
jgi:hypothetical protein